MAKMNKDDFIKALKDMTMLEIKDLIEGIEKEFGVSAAAPAAAAAPTTAAAAPTEVTVFLKETGANKVGVIKVVREITGLGLMEAKAVVDSAPGVVKENVKVEEAEKMKKMFIEAGATIEFK
ncbi:MAG: 50S ribosomal protein L7/L12 [Malacoplasma sp.]